MELTKEDRLVLKTLVKKEIKEIKSDANKVMISNSGFLNKEDESDLPFLKTELLYEDFLNKLLNKL